MNKNVNDDQQNQFDADKAQLKALMQVINEITNNNVPLIDQARPSDIYMPQMVDLVTNKNIRNLMNWASEYTFDDGDLVQDLKSAIVELQYLLAVIKDLRVKVKEGEIVERELQERCNNQASEIQRLERLAANAN